jgi:hypothetical protein
LPRALTVYFFAQKLVDVVSAAAAAASQEQSQSLAEMNAQSDGLLQSLKDVYAMLRQEILQHREPRTSERTVYEAREALQLTGLRSGVMRTHVDAMLMELPAGQEEAVEKR